jgi:galactoside O-acetyltransferase
MFNFFIKVITKILTSKFKTFSIGSNTTIFGWRVGGDRTGSITIGHDSVIKSKVYFEKSGSYLNVGNRSFVGKGIISIADQVEIGDDVMVSWGVSITDHNSHSIKFSERSKDILSWNLGKKDWSDVKTSQVKICDKSWIGFNSIILKGIVIGEGAIVGAGSVVTKDVAPWTIVAGNPAKLIRKIELDER